MKKVNFKNEPYSLEYFKSRRDFFNSRISTFKEDKNGNFRTENGDNKISLDSGISLLYKDKIFSRLDGHMYCDFLEWENFPILIEGREIWMSLTPMEIASHWAPIKLAEGRVGVGGLGLGYYVQSIVDKTNVWEIVVYETNKDIIDLYIRNFGENEKVKIVNQDVLTVNNEEFDFFYNDIYPSMLEGEVLEHMKKLRWNNLICEYFFWGMDAMIFDFLNDGLDIGFLPLGISQACREFGRSFVSSPFLCKYRGIDCSEMYDDVVGSFEECI